MRHYHRCTDCLAVAVTDERLLAATCGACGGTIEYMGAVEGDSSQLTRTSLECPCDHRCTGARGPKCDCPCKGANHGSGLMVRVTRVVGEAPKLEIQSTAKLRAIAAEYRQGRAAIWKALQELGELKRARGWLPAEHYSRWCKLNRCHNAIRKARVHASRMKSIRHLLPELQPVRAELPPAAELPRVKPATRQLALV